MLPSLEKSEIDPCFEGGLTTVLSWVYKDSEVGPAPGDRRTKMVHEMLQSQGFLRKSPSSYAIRLRVLNEGLFWYTPNTN